jgi:hypothetical protein
VAEVEEAPEAASPKRLAAESAAVGLGTLAVTLVALRARPDWLRGVTGGGDAWQNLWNIRHVDRALREGQPLFFSREVWAPEGAGLWAHTLSPTNSVPGALLGRLTGFPFAYDMLVVFAFVVAAVATYRLARRLGFGALGSALSAFVFAFAPQHFARALGHLNLLGTGWIPLALEGLVVAARSEGRRAWAAAVGCSVALVLLVFTDWYLALLGAFAALVFALFETARAAPGRRRAVAGRLLLAGGLALAATLPAGLALSKEAAGGSTGGHEAAWCSCAVTSLVVPSRVQLVSWATWPLTERNTQNRAEGAGYLGLVPLLATLWVSTGRRRERALAPALWAGGVALVLALGPKPRVFDRLVDFPLPYAFLERLFPRLKLGGCVNRLEVLAFLPLALGTAAAADRLLSRGTRGARFALIAASVFLPLEYAPIDPGVSVWPLLPADPSMVAIAGSSVPGNVLDVDPGAAALIRQMRHGRPQIFGYLSKPPVRQREARLEDILLGPLLDTSRTGPALPPAAAAAALRHRWGIAFVVSPDVEPYRGSALRLGFPLFAKTPGLSIVYRLPEEPLASLEEVRLGGGTIRNAQLGVFVWGFFKPETLTLGAERLEGRWTGPEGRLLVPLAPGRHLLKVAAPRPFPPRLTVRWGRGREIVRTVTEPDALEVDIAPEEIAKDGTVMLTFDATPFAAADGRVLGVFVGSIRTAGLRSDRAAPP